MKSFDSAISLTAAFSAGVHFVAGSWVFALAMIGVSVMFLYWAFEYAKES